MSPRSCHGIHAQPRTIYNLLSLTFVDGMLSDVQQVDPYPNKYKGLGIALSILNRCLDGGYLNFGVLALYGDRALDQAMDVSFKLVFAMPLAELMVSILVY
jgi:hypothetical protein